MSFKSFLSVGVIASFMITGHAAWADPVDNALAKIAECNEKRCNQLRLGGIKGLTVIPEEALSISKLDSLDLSRLEITDLSMLTKMPWLNSLNLSEIGRAHV